MNIYVLKLLSCQVFKYLSQAGVKDLPDDPLDDAPEVVGAEHFLVLVF